MTFPTTICYHYHLLLALKFHDPLLFIQLSIQFLYSSLLLKITFASFLIQSLSIDETSTGKLPFLHVKSFVISFPLSFSQTY